MGGVISHLLFVHLRTAFVRARVNYAETVVIQQIKHKKREQANFINLN
jgi:hypothetical protein